MKNKRQKNQRFFSYAFFPKNRRGISGVIVVIVMIALALVLGTIVWGVVNNLLKEEISKGSSCFGIFDKISIERRYTCYDYDTNETRIQLRIGDINVDSVLISISGNTKSETFTLTNDPQLIENLVPYSGGLNSQLPEKNQGITYVHTWGLTDPPAFPNLIRIAPRINNNQCDTVDTLSGIDDCSFLI